MADLTPAMQKFILHWGEMGTRWGINRTMAQIHALLYLSERPLDAEEIAETLSVARSNVSTSLRELQSWGLVRLVHVMGDRRDHFESLKDVWEMFRIVLDERKKRECDPTIAALRESLTEAKRSKREEYAAGRIAAMLEFLESMAGAYDQARRVPTGALKKAVKATGGLRKLFGVGAE